VVLEESETDRLEALQKGSNVQGAVQVPPRMSPSVGYNTHHTAYCSTCTALYCPPHCMGPLCEGCRVHPCTLHPAGCMSGGATAGCRVHPAPGGPAGWPPVALQGGQCPAPCHQGACRPLVQGAGCRCMSATCAGCRVHVGHLCRVQGACRPLVQGAGCMSATCAGCRVHVGHLCRVQGACRPLCAGCRVHVRHSTEADGAEEGLTGSMMRHFPSRTR